MQTLTYIAVFETTNTGYSAYFPDLPGCITVGRDLEETKRYAQEALHLHLSGMQKDNESFPNASMHIECDDPTTYIVPITIYLEK